MTQITRALNNDHYLAAINSSNADASNPFSTQKDSIYLSDGDIGTNRKAKLTDTFQVLKSSGQVIAQIAQDSLSINSALSDRASLYVSGNVSGNIVRFDNGAGGIRYLLAADGSSGTGAGINASTVANFGHVHRVNNKSYGAAYYATNCTTAGLAVQMLGTTNRGIYVANQGNQSGVVSGVNSNLNPSNASYIYPIRGQVRNGSVEASGVLGEVIGGGSISSSYLKAGVTGRVYGSTDSTHYGGDFYAKELNSATVYTKDRGGVKGYSYGSTNVASTCDSIGGEFLALRGAKNYAIRVPVNGVDGITNEGTVLIGANDSVNDSIVEIHGNIETIGGANGFIMEADNGDRVHWKAEYVSGTGAASNYSLTGTKI